MHLVRHHAQGEIHADEFIPDLFEVGRENARSTPYLQTSTPQRGVTAIQSIYERCRTVPPALVNPVGGQPVEDIGCELGKLGRPG